MRNEINADIKEAFDTDLKDAVKPFVGERIVKSDSLNDWLENDSTEQSLIQYEGRGVFSGYSLMEVLEQSVSKGDVKLICLQAETTQEPLLDDFITADDIKYRIISITKDPVNVSYSIQLRSE